MASRKSSPSAAASPAPGTAVDRQNWVAAAALLLAVVIAYGGTLAFPFHFDDTPAIVLNPTIHHWFSALRPPGDSTVSGRPILNLTFAANYALGGLAPEGYHLGNLAILFLSSLLLFGIVRRTLIGRRQAHAGPIAFTAALFWVLHPLQTESVTYLVQRAEALMGLFFLLTLYCFIRGVAPAHPNRPRWFVFSVLACLLGTATKEVTAVVPLIVLAYDRTFVAGSWREAFRRHGKWYLALAACWIPLGGLVASAGWDRNGTMGFGVGVTPLAYWSTQFEAVTRYGWLALFPHPLVFDYGTAPDAGAAALAGFAILVLLLLVTVGMAVRRWPAVGFLGVCFFVILAPTSIVPGRMQVIVEHRMYLPLAAVMTLVALALWRVAQGYAWVVSAILAVVLASLTWQRNADYRTEVALWRDTVAKRPRNDRAHTILGVALMAVPGGQAEAIGQFEAALELKPADADANYNLGFALLQIPGRADEAGAHLARAVQAKPADPIARNCLGLALAQTPGGLHDALAQFAEAIRLKPEFAEAHNNLGNGWLQEPGHLDDAIGQFQEALRLQPDYAAAHNNLGLAWTQVPGHLPDAAREFEAALRLQPDSAPGWHDLGVIRLELGDFPAAAAAFRQELQLKPNDPAAREALAAALQNSLQ